MKEKYIKPIMELKAFEAEDKISDSVFDAGDNDLPVIGTDWN